MTIKYSDKRSLLNFLKRNIGTSLMFLALLVAPLMGYAQYAFKKEKEFRIDSLYPVELVDYHPGGFIWGMSRWVKGALRLP